MRLDFTMRAALFLALAVVYVVARPNPEADAGYSYKPPSLGIRQNFQPYWVPVPADKRTRASEVTVEQVPIRLVQHSAEVRRPHNALPPPPTRGAYNFPSGPTGPSGPARFQQESQQFRNNYHQGPQGHRRGGFNFPSASSPGDFSGRSNLNNNFNRGGQQPYNNYRFNEFSQQQRPAHFFGQQPGNNGYQFDRQQHARIMGFSPNPSYNTLDFSGNYRGNNNNNFYRPTGPGSNNNNYQQYAAPNNYNNNPNLNNNFGQQYAAPQNNNNNYNKHQHNPTFNAIPHSPAPTQSYPASAPSKNREETTAATNGYPYAMPTSPIEEPQQEEIPTTTETAPSNTTEYTGPRITIAISKSTVIHTGKGSYKIDEKTGKPHPIIAEAHSYAGLPEPTTKKPTDALNEEGTGNIPIIARGTPPEEESDENQVDSTTEENTEYPTTPYADEEEEEATVKPSVAPQPHVPQVSSNTWPLKSYGGHHAHVIVAPGQTQFFALGTSVLNKRHLFTPTVTSPQYVTAPTQYLAPSAAGLFYQQPLTYAQHYGVYQPTILAKSALSLPYAPYYPTVTHYPTAYNTLGQVLQYAQEVMCNKDEAPAQGPVNDAPVADAPIDERLGGRQEQEPQQDQEIPQQQPQATLNTRIINRGGVAVAGPGGMADAGYGGTAIVGPGGRAYSSPNGISIVGPGGKVLLQGAETETVLAKGPIIYFHKA